VTLWNQHQVTRVDVLQRQECDVVGIFKYELLRNATGDYLAEDAWTRLGHGA
jgi:hypothetical protein